MKKIISLFMALGMVLSLAACSTNQSPSESTPEEQPDSSAEAQQPTMGRFLYLCRFGYE